MQNEISDGAKLGIVLIALAAIIALGFGVFAIAKGTANDGIVQVQDSLGTVSQQQFMDYDQKIISGTQVTSALKSFEGKPVAVLVQTKAVNDGQTIANTKDHPVAQIITADTAKVNASTGALDYFINYNALLAKNPDGAIGSTVTGGSDPTSVATPIKLTSKNGTYNAEFGFAQKDGSVLFDNSTAGVYKSGNAEFISTTAKFQANLIKDKSGTIVGIVCNQL